jgi:hypothetical protein
MLAQNTKKKRPSRDYAKEGVFTNIERVKMRPDVWSARE